MDGPILEIGGHQLWMVAVVLKMLNNIERKPKLFVISYKYVLPDRFVKMYVVVGTTDSK